MHEEHSFSDLFLKFLLQRSMRIQADLGGSAFFNSSERRLAPHSVVDGGVSASQVSRNR